MAIKVCLVVVEDYTDLFSTSLNIHVFYKEKGALTLSVSSNHSSSSLRIQELDNCVCDKFVLMVVKYHNIIIDWPMIWSF